MSISINQYREMLLRTEKNQVRHFDILDSAEAEREVGHGGLQEQILEFCKAQWPPWKVIQARPDKRSTIPVGCQDMTIFASRGRIILVECKAKGKKPRLEQLQWAKSLEMLGHQVHFVWSYGEFIQIIYGSDGVLTAGGIVNPTPSRNDSSPVPNGPTEAKDGPTQP